MTCSDMVFAFRCDVLVLSLFAFLVPLGNEAEARFVDRNISFTFWTDTAVSIAVIAEISTLTGT